MRRREIHEEHINHEAWAIPYGDLITLLLAFFVVMYSISSVNEGKYRTVANSIQNAFNGSPKVIDPIQVGKEPSMSLKPSVLTMPQKPTSEPIAPPLPAPAPEVPKAEQAPTTPAPEAEDRLAGIGDRIEQAMAPLIDRQLMVVRRHRMNLEVEIRADVLFPSGVANLSPQALPPLRDIAGILAGFSNPLRVEGHTDDVPIATAEFPSNWELSAARAGSVARLFSDHGVDSGRIAIFGWGDTHPVASNATAEGRNRNRRIAIVVLGDRGVPKRYYSSDPHSLAATSGVAATPALAKQSAKRPSAPAP
ncbi:MAG TPA: flagellar motor protein MotD, partial [Rhodanobacteraceae bacterium]|nr:flagellar motor protein MotD [Rhodanobacteraceae bacterium]